ncbi:MAG: ABC transporter ATP-binding protein/permease [Candidatus Symbiothrix sp.]|jgi:subfamily B ATP-binding cassette protein MsbA|nr:ABC transporter ATP-binding protein/permease [Candidatus Symbiothrix sp.]
MNNIKQFLKEKFETLYFFYQYLGYRMVILLAFGFLMVLMDSIGLAMFVPLLQVAETGASEQVSESNGKIGYYVQEVFQFLHLPVNIYSMLMLIILLFVLKGVFYYYSGKYTGINQNLFSKGIRSRLADGVRDMAYKDFVSTDIGRLQNSMMGESSQVVYACAQYLETIKHGLFILVYLVGACFLDWKFSILVAAGGAATNLIYSRFYKRTQQLSMAITKNNHRYGAIVVEVINHYKYIKSIGRNVSFFQRLNDELNNLIHSSIRVATLSARLGALREPMTIAVICAVIALQVSVFESSLSDVIIVLFFFYRIMQKVVDIQATWNNYLTYYGSLENIQSFQKYLDQHGEKQYGSLPLEQIEKIELKDVVLRYGDVYALNKINLTIHRNQSVAFVGESGSGKTSLVNVICTLFPFDSGEFAVNGRSINEYLNIEYKSKIGYIAQESTVFNADIFDNVTFWDERTPENMNKFRQVMTMSRMDEFVESLPEKENALLGNNGINVSGGQKQRISIARELYRNVEILIMDEATSALDSETEWMIKESIESLQGQVTIISIAHRLSTIQHADIIYLLDKGEIVAGGNFEELKKRSTYFKKLTELQGM